ncbi:methyltransferase [Sorangium sp. So ce448]|uniref:tRNA1(Val) (adenine(37)-N6)-methyltransferase n=1 Tax=Sorangium sp. So ce448 TaxID=3133314 RepID=UPI003F5EE4D8
MLAPPDVQPSLAPSGGVVRPARRPPGWVVPGPRPATPDRPDVWPAPGEDLCYLSGDFRILQRLDGHRWSADDLVTAWFAAERVASTPPRRTVDLGCGIGTVLLFTAWRFPDARCVGVEAQEVSASMARRSVAWNGVDARGEVRWGDLRDPAVLDGLAPAELVTGTPPYLPVGSGIESYRVQCGPCRFEHRGGVEDYCLAAARLLAPGAPFVACAGARQRPRVEAAAAAAGLALEAWRDVVPKEGRAALFAVYALRRAEAVASCHDEPPLVLRGGNGRFTEEFDALRRTMGMPV